MLRCMHTSRLGDGSPTYALGALQHWIPGLKGQHHDMNFLVSNMGSHSESCWLKGLHNRASLTVDGLVNITRMSLTFDGHLPSSRLAAEVDNSAEEFAELALGLHWCALLQAAVNL